jgi:hypothetical protein
LKLQYEGICVTCNSYLAVNTLRLLYKFGRLVLSREVIAEPHKTQIAYTLWSETVKTCGNSKVVSLQAWTVD